MTSPIQSNDQSQGSIYQFAKTVQKKLKGDTFGILLTASYVGIDVELQFTPEGENAKLTAVVTRGDGVQGEDILNYTKDIQRLPTEIPSDIFDNKPFELIGTIIVLKDDLKAINEARASAGHSEYSSGVNAVAAAIRDSLASHRDKLTFVLTNAITDKFKDDSLWNQLTMVEELTPYSQTPSQLKFDSDRLKILVNYLGVLEHMGTDPVAKTLTDHYVRYLVKRDKLSFELDGVLMRVDSKTQQKRLGTIDGVEQYALKHSLNA